MHQNISATTVQARVQGGGCGGFVPYYLNSQNKKLKKVFIQKMARVCICERDQTLEYQR